MKLLKIVTIFFIIYFIRRFIQAYKVMKQIQEENERLQRAQSQNNHRQQEEASRQRQRPEQSQQPDVVNADFRVID